MSVHEINAFDVQAVSAFLQDIEQNNTAKIAKTDEFSQLPNHVINFGLIQALAKNNDFIAKKLSPKANIKWVYNHYLDNALPQTDAWIAFSKQVLSKHSNLIPPEHIDENNHHALKLVEHNRFDEWIGFVQHNATTNTDECLCWIIEKGRSDVFDQAKNQLDNPYISLSIFKKAVQKNNNSFIQKWYPFIDPYSDDTGLLSELFQQGNNAFFNAYQSHFLPIADKILQVFKERLNHMSVDHWIMLSQLPITEKNLYDILLRITPHTKPNLIKEIVDYSNLCHPSLVDTYFDILFDNALRENNTSLIEALTNSSLLYKHPRVLVKAILSEKEEYIPLLEPQVNKHDVLSILRDEYSNQRHVWQDYEYKWIQGNRDRLLAEIAEHTTIEKSNNKRKI